MGPWSRAGSPEPLALLSQDEGRVDKSWGCGPVSVGPRVARCEGFAVVAGGVGAGVVGTSVTGARRGPGPLPLPPGHRRLSVLLQGRPEPLGPRLSCRGRRADCSLHCVFPGPTFPVCSGPPTSRHLGKWNSAPRCVGQRHLCCVFGVVLIVKGKDKGSVSLHRRIGTVVAEVLVPC